MGYGMGINKDNKQKKGMCITVRMFNWLGLYRFNRIIIAIQKLHEELLLHFKGQKPVCSSFLPLPELKRGQCSYSLYGLLPSVDHPVHRQVMGAFEGTSTIFTDVVSLIWKTPLSQGWVLILIHYKWILKFISKDKPSVLSRHLCGVWHGAAAASVDETSVHTMGDHTHTSFLAGAGTLCGAEIKRGEMKLWEKHIIETLWHLPLKGRPKNTWFKMQQLSFYGWSDIAATI